MIKQEESGSLTIFCICRHGLNPFCEIIHGYDVTMPLGLGRFTMHEVNPPFGKRANDNDRVKWIRMGVLFGIKMLVWWAFLNSLMTVFEYRRQKIASMKDFLGYSHPR